MNARIFSLACVVVFVFLSVVGLATQASSQDATAGDETPGYRPLAPTEAGDAAAEGEPPLAPEEGGKDERVGEQPGKTQDEPPKGSGRTYGLEVWDLPSRYRHEYRDDFDLGSRHGDRDNLDHLRLLVGAKFAPKGPWRYARFAAAARLTRTWGANENVLRAQNKFDLHRAWAEVDPVGREHDLTLRLGRIGLSMPGERLLGEDAWQNHMLSWDGALARWGHGGMQIEAFWARPVVVRNSTDDCAFDRPDNQRSLTGLRLAAPPRGPFAGSLYLLRSRNEQRTPGERGGIESTERWTIGLSGCGGSPGKKGRGSLSLQLDEAAFQFGEEAGEDVEAFAYQVSAVLRPRAGALGPLAAFQTTWSVSSGDKDPTDGEVQRFDPLYSSTPAFSTPFITDRTYWSNFRGLSFTLAFDAGEAGEVKLPEPPKAIGGIQLDAKGGKKKGKAERAEVDLRYHMLWIDERRDAWFDGFYQPIRRDGTGGADKRIGDVLEFLVKKGDLEMGYGHFFPGEFVRDTGASAGADAFYVQVGF